jgi:hypothetical protein
MGSVIFFIPVMAPVVAGTSIEYGNAGTPQYLTSGYPNLTATWDTIQSSPSYEAFTERHGPAIPIYIFIACHSLYGQTTQMSVQMLAENLVVGNIRNIYLYPIFMIYSDWRQADGNIDLELALQTIDAKGLSFYLQRALNLSTYPSNTASFAHISISTDTNHDIPYVKVVLHQPISRTFHMNLNGNLIT